jgi:hypothetical protein
MSRAYHNPTFRHPRRSLRRGVAILYVAICGTVIIGFAALAIDIGMLYVTQAEMQRAADAAAMAATWELLGEERLLDEGYEDYLRTLACESAAYGAARNPVLHDAPVIYADQDVEIGYLSDLNYDGSPVLTDDAPANATRVFIRRDAQHGGSIALFFARLFGSESRDLHVEAVAAFPDGIAGFEVTDESGPAELMPFSVHIDSWNHLLDGSVTIGDNYAYDPETGAVSSGSDGILELNFYPGAGGGQLPPGNFGTVDIGADNNSTADVRRQILYGISAEDLSYFGGRLAFGEDGTFELNGDTGLSAGFKDALEAIIGQPRAIPLFSEVSGPGNNAMYTIVAFGGIRIMDVKLTGPMSQKYVIIQPAKVVSNAVITQPGPGGSDYVYAPVRLVH